VHGDIEDNMIQTRDSHKTSNYTNNIKRHQRKTEVTIGGRCGPNGMPRRGGPGGKNPGLIGSGGGID